MRLFGLDITKADPSKDAIKAELKKVKKQLAKKEKVKQQKNYETAQPHLKAIERYKEMLALSSETRQAELNAIIANRINKLSELGIQYGD